MLDGRLSPCNYSHVVFFIPQTTCARKPSFEIDIRGSDQDLDKPANTDERARRGMASSYEKEAVLEQIRPNVPGLLVRMGCQHPGPLSIIV